MSTAAIEVPLPVNGGESKSARKKKAKAAEAANSNGNSNGTAQAPPTATPQAPAKEESSNGADASGSFEHPHLKELQKQIRNVNKRLAGLQKTDAVQEANPGVSLDDLVAQRKINNDQRAASAKKPQLLEQLASLEEQVTTFRTVDGEYQAQMAKQKESLTEQHRKELDAAKEEHTREAGETGKGELREKLLIFSQFLRAAAAKRNEVDDAGTDESAAFEGALLLVYGGDQTAVKTAVNIIEGSDEQVPSIEGLPLPFKYAQIKQSSIDHAPFQSEEAWAQDVADANATVGEAHEAEAEKANGTATDPTIANATLTELEEQTNGIPAAGPGAHDALTSPVQAGTGDEAGNLAGDRWDTGAGAQAMEESFEMVPRPDEEVDAPAGATTQTAIEQEGQAKGLSWADEATAATAGTASAGDAGGNVAGEAWDSKAAGQSTDAGEDEKAMAAAIAATAPSGELADAAKEHAQPVLADDGFQQIPNRHRGGHHGRGGHGRGGRGGDGEFRGRGGRGGHGRGRGDGEFRGRGDGEFRGGRGRGGFRGDGEFRGGRGGGEGRGRGGHGRGRGGTRGGGGEAAAVAAAAAPSMV